MNKMTPEKKSEFIRFRDKWFQVGVCTARADRPKAEEAILAMRAEIGNDKKPKFIWAESPSAAILSSTRVPRDSLSDSMMIFRNSLRDSLSNYLSNYLRDSMRDSLRASLKPMRDSLWDSLKPIRDSLRDSLRASLKPMRDSLWDSLRDSMMFSLWNCFYGQQESYWIAYYLFCRDILGLKYNAKHSKQLDMWRNVAESCGWWWCYDNYVIISERPSLIKMNADGRIHCQDGPCMAFQDGWKVWAVNGVLMDPSTIERP